MLWLCFSPTDKCHCLFFQQALPALTLWVVPFYQEFLPVLFLCRPCNFSSLSVLHTCSRILYPVTFPDLLQRQSRHPLPQWVFCATGKFLDLLLLQLSAGFCCRQYSPGIC